MLHLIVQFSLFVILFAVSVCVVKIIVKLTAGRCESPVCMVGKTVIITGGNSGLGYQTSLNLASRGCKIIIADKLNSDKSINEIKEKTHNSQIFYKHIDLADFNSIRKFAKDIKETEEKLDVLINNAGVGTEYDNVCDNNVPMIMQVNHLGSFLLTYLLIDLLKKSAPSRIIFVSSLLSFIHKQRKQDFTKAPSSSLLCTREMSLYGNSKLCNIITADKFAKILSGSGVTCNAVHPGLCSTPIFHIWRKNLFLRMVLWILSKSPREGAQTTIYAAVSNSGGKLTGSFLSDCKPVRKPKKAYDKKFCDFIWEVSEQMCEIKPDEKL